MWLFKRSGKEMNTGVPSETNVQPMWLIWLLSAGTFVVTVLIVLGLFWGGRWVINRSTKKPTPATPVVQKPAANKSQGINGISSNGSSKPAPTSSTNPAPKPTTTAPTPAPATTPSTGPSTLVRTGPTSDE